MNIKNGFQLFFFLFLVILTSQLNAQPSIISQPSDSAICSGNDAQFKIIALNAEEYQWQENDSFGWYDIDASVAYASGENTAELQISDASAGLNNYLYRCLVWDAQNIQEISESAALTVNNEAVILNDPVNQNVCRNETAIFSLETENATYFQWQEDNGSGWRNLSNNSFYNGVNTAELSVYTVTGMNGFDYRCAVFNGACRIFSESVNLQVKPLPLRFSVIGGGWYCENHNGAALGLESSETGITYELLCDGNSTGLSLNGTGDSLTFGPQNDPGEYTVVAINPVTACMNEMTGSAIVEIIPQPEVFAFEGEGSFCENEDGTELFLETSDTGITYKLFHFEEFTGVSKSGTGGQLFFGNISSPGEYQLKAENTIYGCNSWMDGIIEVREIPLPDFEAILSENVITVDPDDYFKYSFTHNDVLLQSGISNIFNVPDYLKTGDTVKITVSNDFLCTSVDYIEIPGEVIVINENTNAFTPNGDGINDVFMKGVEINVFNRWGLEIYKGSDGWDGTKNGEMMPPGTYYFIRFIKDSSGNITDTDKGAVTLVKM